MGYEQRKKALHNAIRGWVSYFKYAHAKTHLQAMDEWLRKRIRMCIWKSWKLPRTRVHNLIKCGIPQWRAYQWGNASKGYRRERNTKFDIILKNFCSTSLDDEHRLNVVIVYSLSWMKVKFLWAENI